MDIREAFETDTKKEGEGSWVSIGGAEFKIATTHTMSNIKYAQGWLEVIKATKEDSNDDAHRERTIKLYAETVLLDWRGVEMDGKPLPYSKEKAMDLMRGMPRFYSRIIEEASNIENFRKEKIEEISKN